MKLSWESRENRWFYSLITRVVLKKLPSTTPLALAKTCLTLVEWLRNNCRQFNSAMKKYLTKMMRGLNNTWIQTLKTLSATSLWQETAQRAINASSYILIQLNKTRKLGILTLRMTKNAKSVRNQCLLVVNNSDFLMGVIIFSAWNVLEAGVQLTTRRFQSIIIELVPSAEPPVTSLSLPSMYTEPV